MLKYNAKLSDTDITGGTGLNFYLLINLANVY